MKRNQLILYFLSVLFLMQIWACQTRHIAVEKRIDQIDVEGVHLTILGTVQDAGSPHIACKKSCCEDLFEKPSLDRKVVALGLIDNIDQKTYLLEATPDLPVQMKWLKELALFGDNETPDGIFLTHAHIGHYTGLMYLGKEAMSSKNLPVYAMPRMKNFLENNGPWNQLVTQQNIYLQELANQKPVQLSQKLKVTPFTVPHRDEYSETVGYIIQGPSKKALFIPDIDKWERWGKSIEAEIAKVDYAFLDATFYDAEEVNNRDISQIPHPFIIESMRRFANLSKEEKIKIHFIHFNHTNPALNMDSEQSKQIKKNGFNISQIFQQFKL